MQFLSAKKFLVIFALLLVSTAIHAQQPPAKSQSPSTMDHFAFGKTLLLKKASVSDIAFETIESDMQGWGRFVVVDAPQKADLIAEVSSEQGGGVTRTDTAGYASDGRPQSSSGTNKDVSPSTVSLKVYDARSKLILWSGTEHAKFALKQKTQENNLVEAAQRLFEKFHDKIEPPTRE
jgi:hypothetical protein